MAEGGNVECNHRSRTRCGVCSQSWEVMYCKQTKISLCVIFQSHMQDLKFEKCKNIFKFFFRIHSSTTYCFRSYHLLGIACNDVKIATLEPQGYVWRKKCTLFVTMYRRLWIGCLINYQKYYGF
jgi:hypothetical protein